MDQFCGVVVGADLFLEENEVWGNLKVIGFYEGMSGDKFPLLRHQLKDGTYVDEYLQHTESRPGTRIFFLGLRFQNGTTITWSGEEINEYSNYLQAGE